MGLRLVYESCPRSVSFSVLSSFYFLLNDKFMILVHLFVSEHSSYEVPSTTPPSSRFGFGFILHISLLFLSLSLVFLWLALPLITISLIPMFSILRFCLSSLTSSLSSLSPYMITFFYLPFLLFCVQLLVNPIQLFRLHLWTLNKRMGGIYLQPNIV